MLENIKKFFIEKMEVSAPEPSRDSSRSVALATCALLLEMAYADDEFSEAEKNNILAIIKEHLDLNENDAGELIELAELERKESLDLWQFTNLINQTYSKEEKRKVVETLWFVIYTDGKVDKHEEYLMRKLTYLLNLEHKDMIEAKLNARDNKQQPENF